MPRKSRRAKSRSRTRLAEAAQRSPSLQARTVPLQPELPSRPSSVSVKAPQEADGSIRRYGYVVAEVKRIGILAGAIVLTLIVLSFILG